MSYRRAALEWTPKSTDGSALQGCPLFQGTKMCLAVWQGRMQQHHQSAGGAGLAFWPLCVSANAFLHSLTPLQRSRDHKYFDHPLAQVALGGTSRDDCGMTKQQMSRTKEPARPRPQGILSKRDKHRVRTPGPEGLDPSDVSMRHGCPAVFVGASPTSNIQDIPSTS